MKAFHNDQEIKDKYLARVNAHALADEIVKGKYWEQGKGCAIGCTIHGSDHSRYETELGIPKWLAKLEDRIFEGLPNERAKKWPIEFLEAIKPGQDLEKVKIPILIFIVESARESFDHKKYPKQLIAIDKVLVELKKEILDRSALRAAATAPDAYAATYTAATYAANATAAYAADAAAYAAAASAYAAYTSADAATYAAAASAAYAAAASDAAAFDAARQNTYVKFADKLLELIKAIEPIEKKDTADGLLRELIENTNECVSNDFLARVKRLLDKKDKE